MGAKPAIRLCARPGHSEPKNNISQADLKASVTLGNLSSRRREAEKALRGDQTEDCEHPF